VSAPDPIEVAARHARDVIFGIVPGVRRTGCFQSPVRRRDGRILYLTEPTPRPRAHWAGNSKLADTATRMQVEPYSPAALRATIFTPHGRYGSETFELSFLPDEADAVGTWLAARVESLSSGAPLAAPAFDWAAWKSETTDWLAPQGYAWTARAWAAQLEYQKNIAPRRARTAPAPGAHA
jgi:hypothetical protein